MLWLKGGCCMACADLQETSWAEPDEVTAVKNKQAEEAQLRIADEKRKLAAQHATMRQQIAAQQAHLRGLAGSGAPGQGHNRHMAYMMGECLVMVNGCCVNGFGILPREPTQHSCPASWWCFYWYANNVPAAGASGTSGRMRGSQPCPCALLPASTTATGSC